MMRVWRAGESEISIHALREEGDKRERHIRQGL